MKGISGKQNGITKIRLNVNGRIHDLTVKPWTTLLEVIRDGLNLTGTKEGCSIGECGACTVILEGKAVNSCLVLAAEADGKKVLTVEGLAEGEQLHPIQQAFVDHGGIQCGFCTSGMILAAKALLDTNSNPTEEEIRQAIEGNLCRCTGYAKIIESIAAAAEKMKERDR
jgi:carbon-monoxide dehydrogenase small subunit